MCGVFVRLAFLYVVTKSMLRTARTVCHDLLTSRSNMSLYDDAPRVTHHVIL